jgi:hypothetical protein
MSLTRCGAAGPDESPLTWTPRTRGRPERPGRAAHTGERPRPTHAPPVPFVGEDAAKALPPAERARVTRCQVCVSVLAFSFES